MKEFDFMELKKILNSKLITISFFLLMSCSFTYSQSDTVQWDKYLFIKARMANPTRYVYEFQDTLGNIVIPQEKYHQLSKPDEFGYINAWKESTGGKVIENNVGFIDINQNILIPFEFSRVFSFSHNLACANKNGKTGYINRNGKTVIPFVYDSRMDFSDYGVVVIRKGGKDVLLDTIGNEIIGDNHPYDKIKENLPHDHVLLVQKNKKWAFFNLKGMPLSPFIYDKLYPANICPYEPGLYYGERLRWFYKGLAVVENDKQFAVINDKMELVVPWDTYQWISPVSVGGVMIVKKNNKYGLLNHQLELMQSIDFDTISNQPACSYEQDYPSFWARKDNKYFIFDTVGNWIDRTEYDKIELLKTNFYLVTKKGESWRVDRNGSRVIEDFVVMRDEGDGFIAKKDSKVGYVNYSGEIILPFKYEDIVCESHGNIFVKKNGKWGVVDDENQQLLPFNYDYIEYAWDKSANNESNYIVVQNDKFGKVSETGDEIFSCLYDGITTWVEYGPDGHYVMIGGKAGLIDYNGKVVIPIEYDGVQSLFGTKWAILYNDDKMGLCDKSHGNIFLTLEYDYLFVDHSSFDIDKPVRIATYKNDTINILSENGNVIYSNVLESELGEKYNIEINKYYPFPCTYELLLMIHNRTFNPPECLLDIFKKDGYSIESIYYNMRKK